jgi:hypothetical protein
VQLSVPVSSGGRLLLSVGDQSFHSLENNAGKGYKEKTGNTAEE